MSHVDYRPEQGLTIYGAACGLVALAGERKKEVTGDFNGTVVTAKPGEKPETVISRYRKLNGKRS